MTDIKVPSSGNIRAWWGLANAFANYEAPTAVELNACLDISESISWNDLGFGLQASNTIDDPAITAIGKVSDRGASQFGGAISFYYPGAFGDTSNDYAVTYDALDAPRTLGYIVMRVDGEQTATVAEAADLVQVFKVMTDGYAESITGEEAFRYTVSFLSQGDLAVRAVVKGVSAIAVITPATLAIVVGAKSRLTATVDGRNYTNGVKWSTSAPAKATVSSAGVVTGVAAGTANITATYEATGATDVTAVTVS
jgi:uncharacterized protein YjdB